MAGSGAAVVFSLGKLNSLACESVGKVAKAAAPAEAWVEALNSGTVAAVEIFEALDSGTVVAVEEVEAIAVEVVAVGAVGAAEVLVAWAGGA